MESNRLERCWYRPYLPTYVTARGNSIQFDHVFTNVPGVKGVTSDPHYQTLPAIAQIIWIHQHYGRNRYPKSKYRQRSCWRTWKMKIHGIAWTLVICYNWTLPRKAEELYGKWSLQRTCWQRRKAEYRRWIWPPCSPNASLPQQRKSSEVRRREEAGHTWRTLSPELQILETALAPSRYWHGKLLRKSSKGRKELQRLKMPSLTYFSDEVELDEGEWHDEDHLFHDHEPEEATISSELLGWIVGVYKRILQIQWIQTASPRQQLRNHIILNLQVSHWWLRCPTYQLQVLASFLEH